MNQYSGDSGFQLIIDNRKIVIAGIFLLLVCGSFFVIGYIEGKRQGMRSAENSALAGVIPQSQAQQDKTGPQSKTKETPVRDQLSWYNDVNKSGKAPVQGLEPKPDKAQDTAPGSSPGTGGRAVPGAGSAATGTTKPVEPPKLGPVTYSVQIGAFKYRKEAETKAAELKEKKYNGIIESPEDSEQLFLLKVGRFESRADAVAMQNRLKKDGFKTFIKTNK